MIRVDPQAGNLTQQKSSQWRRKYKKRRGDEQERDEEDWMSSSGYGSGLDESRTQNTADASEITMSETSFDSQAGVVPVGSFTRIAEQVEELFPHAELLLASDPFPSRLPTPTVHILPLFNSCFLGLDPESKTLPDEVKEASSGTSIPLQVFTVVNASEEPSQPQKFVVGFFSQQYCSGSHHIAVD